MFLSNGQAIAQQIEDLIAVQPVTSPICIAVAFWGVGAEMIVSGTHAPLRLVCNLRSGGTNPQVVRFLQTRAKVKIKQLNTLHAKVVVTEAGAIVSSANLSANGLGLEGVGSLAWQEAGLFVEPGTTDYEQITRWFSQIWSQSRVIYETDLVQAEQAWAHRNVLGQQGASPQSPPESTILDVQTVRFQDRIKPRQRNLRSAAAIVALNGQGGELMPLSAFKFLFSGGKTERAFDNHEDKFKVVDDDFVRLEPPYIGYFVGRDGKLTSCDDVKRRKNADDPLVAATALWMLRRGPRPESLEGEVEEGRFQIHGSLR